MSNVDVKDVELKSNNCCSENPGANLGCCPSRLAVTMVDPPFILSPKDTLDIEFRPVGWTAKGASRRVLDKGFVRLVDWMGNDDSIVRAARVSYGQGIKTIEEDKKLINFLIRERHTSPLEQVTFTFHVKAPLFVFRQWHRHRTWSYNEVSARYTEMKDEFYIPETTRITKQDKKNKQGSTNEQISEAETAVEMIRRNSDESYLIYQDLLNMGVARELARTVLPVNLYSEMFATVNLHNLMHFLKLRLGVH